MEEVNNKLDEIIKLLRIIAGNTEQKRTSLDEFINDLAEAANSQLQELQQGQCKANPCHSPEARDKCLK